MVKGEKGGNWLFLGQRGNEHGGSILYEGRRLVFINGLAGREVGGVKVHKKGVELVLTGHTLFSLFHVASPPLFLQARLS